jgi:hypothetical protein
VGFDTFNDLRTAYDSGKRYLSVVHKAGTSNATGGFYSTWTFTGQPTAGTATGVTLTATDLDRADTGAFQIGRSAGDQYLLRLSANALTSSGQAPYFLLVYDRLLYYPMISAVSTSSQPLTNVATLPRYTDGVGVMAWLEVTTAFGTGTGTFTFGDDGYTNSAGVTGRQHGVTVLTVASAALNRLPHGGGITLNNNYSPFLPLQAGDVGIRSVQSVAFTAAHSAGVCALVLGKPLAVISVPQFKINAEREFVFNLPTIDSDACLSALFWAPTALGASVVQGLDFETVWNS